MCALFAFLRRRLAVCALSAFSALSALPMLAWAQAEPPAPAASVPAPFAGQPVLTDDPSSLAAALPPSPDAQQVYRAARDKLVQIRTLRRATNTQSSIGSGFYVGGDGLVVTNFHVVSDLALEPDRHRGVSVSVGGQERELALLAFDVRHDLAVLRHAQKPSGAALPVLALRPEAEPLAQGERIYSLGNPLDVGFAITEGTYNGLVQRSFYPRIFFGGVLNPGMSGGPALDAQGRVIGVNVAKRGDAEQVSFLVPGTFVQALLARARHAEPLREPAHGEMARQLLLHQQALVDRVLAAPPRHERYGGYLVPVPDESLARCWGDGQERRTDALMDYERSECRIDSAVFTGHAGEVGGLRMRYEAYDGQRLNPLAFARQYSASFANEPLPQRRTRVRSAAECREDFVRLAGGMPVRAVLCLTAYRKLPGLHDLAVLVASVNQPRASVLGRLDVRGLSVDNALRLARHYLDGFAWESGAAP